MASQVTIWPARSSSSISFCTAGISLDLSSISMWARTSAVSTANAVSTCLALASLKLSKLPFSVLPSNAMTRVWGARRSEIQVRGVFTEDLFDLGRAQPLQNIADRGMRRRPLPLDLEGFIQPSPMRLDVSADAAIGVGAAHHGENGEQQHVR